MKNLDEFLKKTEPGARKSLLYEYLTALKLLQEKQYTLKQMKDFLLENGVVVSTAWLSAFLRAHSDSHSQKKNGELPKQSHATRASPVSPVTTTATAGNNPLHVLSGKPKVGDYNPIPTAKFEVDNT